MARKTPTLVAGVLIACIAAALFFLYLNHDSGEYGLQRNRKKSPTPVEVASIRHGRLSLWRTFSGTIEPRAQFTVAPKVGGTIKKIFVDVADEIGNGELLVQLDDAEFEQAVIEAEARMAVAEANRVEAVSRLEIAQRELNRIQTLFNRGISSESALDTAKATFLTSQAAVKVAEANLKREEAQLRAARIRLGYTSVEAQWHQGDALRTVAERFADEGNTVAANTPIFSIVEIDPVIAVIQVTEKDYPLISLGQQAKVQADAFPDQFFEGTVTSIAPIFRESSRQARLEVEVDNDDHLLKPGMFTRCTLELERIENGRAIPRLALTKRKNEQGVFLITDAGSTVNWIKVATGFSDGGWVQLIDPELDGMVVTLGQQFLDDGSSVRIAGKTTVLPENGESR